MCLAQRSPAHGRCCCSHHEQQHPEDLWAPTIPWGGTEASCQVYLASRSILPSLPGPTCGCLLADDSSIAVVMGLAWESSPPHAPAAYDNLIDQTAPAVPLQKLFLGLTLKRLKKKKKSTLPNISVIRSLDSALSLVTVSEPEGAAELPLLGGIRGGKKPAPAPARPPLGQLLVSIGIPFPIHRKQIIKPE